MKNILLIALIIITTISFGQNVPFDKSYFKGRKKEFKQARNKFEDGNSYFESEQYYQALESYLDANSFNPDNAELNFKIGDCYLNSVQKNKSLKYFLKASELNHSVNKKIEYFIGKGYHLNGKYKEAITHYKLYKSNLLPNQLEDVEDVSKRIKECNSALSIIDKPARAFIENLSDLNTSYSEHSPVITADESKIMFTSTRPGSVGNELDEISQEYDEDIYVSYKVNGRWTKPINAGEPLNTRMNDATVGLSSDGQLLLIYNGMKRNGDIQSSELDGDEWTYPKWLPSSVNSKEKETSASFSGNDKALYFISNREGGYGGKDIYVSYKNNRGKWGKAKNIGPAINTQYDEPVPVIANRNEPKRTVTD